MLKPRGKLGYLLVVLADESNPPPGPKLLRLPPPRQGANTQQEQ